MDISEHHFKYLPDLALLRILDFLNLNSRKNMMLTSKRYYELLQLSRYSKQMILSIRTTEFSPTEEPWNFLINSTRRFPSIALTYYHMKGLNRSEELWKKIGQKTVELHLHLKNDVPTNFLTWFPELSSLKIDHNEVLNGLFIPKTIQNIIFFYIYLNEPLVEERYKKNLRFLGSGIVFLKTNEVPEPLRWICRCEFNHGFRTKNINFLNVKEIQLSDITDISCFCQLSLIPTHDTDILSKLPHLASFNFHNFFSNCFFVHKIVKFSCVKKVHFNYSKDDYCKICAEFVAQSFPNISELMLKDSKTHSYAQLIRIIAEKGNLTKLNYRSNFNIQIMDVLFPSLVSLRLYGDFKLEGLQTFLNILDLKISTLTFSEAEIDLLIKSFPNVVKAWLDDMVLLENHLKLMKKYWKRIQTLYIFRPPKYQKHLLVGIPKLVFEEIPTLRKFKSICRSCVQKNPDTEKCIH